MNSQQTSIFPGSRTAPRTRLAKSTNFFMGQFLRAPATISSPFPSSDIMARALLDTLDWSEIRTFVEYGPGTGVFTRHALGRMRSDARLFAIDAHHHFTCYLRTTIPDRRLVAITGSAIDAADLLAQREVETVDCILSGLPFSLLGSAARRMIVRRSAGLLVPAGLFLAYQVRRSIERSLREVFDTVEHSYHWLNLPPCHLFRASGSDNRHGTRFPRGAASSGDA